MCKSRIGVRLGKFPMVRRNLFFRRSWAESWPFYKTSSRTAQKTPPSILPLWLVYFPCVYLSLPPIVARQLPGCYATARKHVSVAANTHNNRKIVGRIVFYAIRVVSLEGRRLVLPRIYCINSASAVCILPKTRDIPFIARQRNNFFVLILLWI
jgi:hypothetical protein